jgi:hypothetical protein
VTLKVDMIVAKISLLTPDDPTRIRICRLYSGPC